MVPLGIILVFGSTIECVRMVGRSQLGSITLPTLIGTLGIILAAAIPVYWPLFGEPYPADCALGKLGWPLAAMVLSVFCCICWFIPTYEPKSNFFQKAILSGWISVYFGGCFAFAVALRLVGDGGTWGLYLLVGIILVTKSADAGAYFAGRALGRNKLCPKVSPGKTIEGLIGGMLTASLAGWIYFGLCAPYVYGSEVYLPTLGIVLLGVLLTIAGVVGDLVESIFKREMDCKDSGSIFPGLGGMWDVTDSLLPAFTIGYLLVVAELIVGPTTTN